MHCSKITSNHDNEANQCAESVFSRLMCTLNLANECASGGGRKEDLLFHEKSSFPKVRQVQSIAKNATLNTARGRLCCTPLPAPLSRSTAKPSISAQNLYYKNNGYGFTAKTTPQRGYLLFFFLALLYSLIKMSKCRSEDSEFCASGTPANGGRRWSTSASKPSATASTHPPASIREHT